MKPQALWTVPSQQAIRVQSPTEAHRRFRYAVDFGSGDGSFAMMNET